ncbi:exocyst complex component exo84 [Yamadazyma tenuis]|uniref:Exocyst complex component EXO84 n=1 Tax=Candida tenuis (strain ATCC 10573 / BCRC 21748 / CBS 615 / JCM 9827 / NBRC 10315 / NRRL Y-1498 / VKM Y-70) TaxID=590646 RepID=G3BBK1_CANTC|nr:uncharacterized protein CANTEDRAFT_108688 [Yamadazyma tenuis ATCC 10573]EGV61558.1 hypothetical protein CANTEDRAFT_108688 [Yamadazyma tenuis ATCC 10573]WEJ92780.1 exocyst complex component exo84 [Yamadazyma tenuis]
MDFDAKAAHRKSRAPWKLPSSSEKSNNPYANANAFAPRTAESRDSDNLSVPNPYNNRSNKNKKTRRSSIHASASAAAHTRNMIDAAKAPPVPQLPDLNALKAAVESKPARGESDNINSRLLDDLANGTAAEIDDYYKVLVKQRAVVERDIKNSINENQKNILELMTDLKDTQDELLQLRISSRELMEVLDEFKDAAERRLSLEEKPDERSPYGTKKPKRKDRSSIIVLEKMWVSELQSLFKHVEGASKLIQSVQGRHVLAESGRWFEINIGNWKAIKAIHIFVLNDLILIATKKSSSSSKNASNKSRLQAVHCWPLHDVQLQVINQRKADDDPNKTYLISLTTRSGGYVYQTDRYDHFVKINDAYNKGKSELSQKERFYDIRGSTHEDGFETDDEKRQLRESLRNSGVFDEENNNKRRSGSHRHSADILLQDISARVHSRNRSHDFSANGKFSNFTKNDKGQFFNELKRVEDRLDEVDVEIAHDKYPEAVGMINYIENKVLNVERIVSKTETSDQETMASLDEIKLLVDVIKLKLSNRKQEVQRSLSFNLQHNIAKLKTSELGEILEFFYSFGVLDKGISAFLRATTANLANIISKLVVTVQGSTKADVGNYISNMVIIYVSIMKKTISSYKECIFPILERDNGGNVDSSGLINWCIEEGINLIKSIKKQLLGTLLTPEDPDDDNNTKLLIKDKPLFKSFLNVLEPQLDDLKSVGINIDYLFDDILNASSI